MIWVMDKIYITLYTFTDVIWRTTLIHLTLADKRCQQHLSVHAVSHLMTDDDKDCKHPLISHQGGTFHPKHPISPTYCQIQPPMPRKAAPFTQDPLWCWRNILVQPPRTFATLVPFSLRHPYPQVKIYRPISLADKFLRNIFTKSTPSLPDLFQSQ